MALTYLNNAFSVPLMNSEKKCHIGFSIIKCKKRWRLVTLHLLSNSYRKTELWLLSSTYSNASLTTSGNYSVCEPRDDPSPRFLDGSERWLLRGPFAWQRGGKKPIRTYFETFPSRPAPILWRTFYWLEFSLRHWWLDSCVSKPAHCHCYLKLAFANADCFWSIL